MHSVPCAYCGLPVRLTSAQAEAVQASANPAYCCVGCAIASQVPVDEKGQFPITRALLAAVAMGFVLFNQWLTWLLATGLAHEGRAGAAQVAFWASLGLGAVLWVAIVTAGALSRSLRLADAWVACAVVMIATLGLLAGSAAGFALGNAAFATWHARGFLREKTQGKKGLRI